MVLLLGCASQSWAAFSLVPGITFREEYNDNIYLDADDEEDDYITTVAPSLLMKWEGPRIDLSLDARIMFQDYANNSDEDRIGPGEADQGSTFNALVKIVPDIIFLRVSDSYSRVALDEGDRGAEGNNSVNLTDSNLLEVNPYLQFQLMSDLQATVGYIYSNQWYGNEDENDPGEEDDEGDDAESHTYNVGLTKALSSRIALSLNGEHHEYRPKDPVKTFVVDEEGAYEFDKDSVRVGLSYQVNERLHLEGGYGHSWLNYDVRKDVDSDTWDVSADYEISSTLKAGISYAKDYEVTVEDGPSDRDKYSAYLEYDDRIKFRVSAFMTKDEYVEIDRENDSFGGDLNSTLPFTDKSGVMLGLNYTNYDQSGVEAEEYDRYGAICSLYYDISRGRLSLGYTYTRNDSDLEDEDYTNNIAFLAASLSF
jgi:hypothetical protein